MNLKFVGAMCIIFACGSCGFLVAHHHLTKIQQLRDLLTALDYMECELQYRGTSLPQLCRQAGEQTHGKIRQIFQLLANEMEEQISPNVCNCMAAAMDKLGVIDSTLEMILMELGNNLGKFDLSGQLRGLENMRAICREKLQSLAQNNDSRIRSYQTLGLCAGAAIAILFV